jgi:hypothetical protein
LAAASSSPKRHPPLRNNTAMPFEIFFCRAKIRDKKPPSRMMNVELKN